MSDAWRKSSYSGSQANCVEVGTTVGIVKIRDTKDQLGRSIAVSADAWHQFTTEIKG